MCEMYLRFTYRVLVDHLQKTKKEYKGLKKQEFIYLSKRTRWNLFSTWHGLWRFEDWTRRTAPDKIWRDKVVNIARNPKYDGYQRGIASMVYRFFDKGTSRSGIAHENISNKLAE